MQSKYVTVKNSLKGEEELQDGTRQDYGLIDERRSMLSNLYESHQDTDYDYWTSKHKVHTSMFCVIQ
jgi:hypothetical protein